MAEEHAYHRRRRRDTDSTVVKALLAILVGAVGMHLVRQLLKKGREAEPEAPEEFSSHRLGEG